MPPRRYLRLLRFQKAFERSRAAESLAGHAADQGFADQAHMAREFRAMAGVPAKQARRDRARAVPYLARRPAEAVDEAVGAAADARIEHVLAAIVLGVAQHLGFEPTNSKPARSKSARTVAGSIRWRRLDLGAGLAPGVAIWSITATVPPGLVAWNSARSDRVRVDPRQPEPLALPISVVIDEVEQDEIVSVSARTPKPWSGSK